MIILDEVSKSFGNHMAVNRVTLTIPDRAQIALLGPSGSGKTTLLRLIAGLEMPDSGLISMNGRVVSSPGIFVPPYERNIGFAFQSAALWPHKTVAGNILFAISSLSKNVQEERLSTLLERMGIAHLRDRYPDQISGGEARRAALARALASRPETLLCDEPLTNLDRPLRDDLLGLIVESSKIAGSSLLYVTHDEYEATKVADTILRFKNGKIVR